MTNVTAADTGLTAITITCAGCKGTFDFTHPAARDAAALMRVTLTCPHCQRDLKAPDDSLIMEPLEWYLKKTLVRDGYLFEGDKPLPAGVIEVIAPEDNEPLVLPVLKGTIELPPK